MALTLNAAEICTAAVWGRDRIINICLRPDGGADVSLKPFGAASDVRGRTYTSHRLDADGHPTCHTDCESMARDGDDRDEREPPAEPEPEDETDRELEEQS